MTSPGDGASFKVADAYADFEVRVDKGIDEAKAKLKARAHELDTKPDVKPQVEQKSVRAAEAQLEPLKRDIEPKVKPNVDQRASKATDTEMSRVAKRANASFDALKYTGLSVGLPAAAGIGAAGATAALSVLPAAFIGYGLAMLGTNDEVNESFSHLATSVIDRSEHMAQVLAGPLADAGDDLGASFSRMSPLIEEAFTASSKSVDTLTYTVTDFAENAMPGMVKAVKASEPALEGLHTFASDTGAGLGEMFDIMADGAPAAGRGMKQLGGIVYDAEVFFGHLFTTLAEGSRGPLTSLQTIGQQGEQALLKIAQAGGPAVSTLQGFSTVGSGLITVANGIASGLSILPPQLTSMAGTLLATNMVMGKFGVDGAASFRGLAKEVRETGAGLTGAEKAGHKFGTALGGIASGLLSPATLAVGALTVGLTLLGDAQEKAAEYANLHRQNVQGLTDAYRRDAGTIGESTTAFNAQALAAKNTASNLAVYGQGLSTAKLAIEGNVKAQTQLIASGNVMISNIGQQANLNKQQIAGLQDLNAELLANGGNFDRVKDRFADLTQKMGEGGVMTNALTAEQRSLFDAIYNGTGAVGEQAKAMREMKELYYITEQGASGLGRSQIELRDELVQTTTRLYNNQAGMLGYRASVLDVKTALEKKAEVDKNGKASDNDRAAALLGVEIAMHKQEQAAYDSAYANSKATSDATRQAEAFAAMDRETLKLADGMKGPLTQSLQQTIAGMTLAQATAAGATIGINRAGEAVYKLPGGKEVKISAETGAAQEALQRIKNLQDSIQNKTVSYTINVRQINSGQTSQPATQTGRPVMNAKGGMYGPNMGFASGGFPMPTRSNSFNGQAQFVQPGTYKWAGDAKVPELFAPLDGSEKTRKNLLVAAKHEGLLGPQIGFADGGLIGAAKEMLSHLSSGGQFFEDFSYYGNSDLVSKHNDQIAALFRQARPGWNFDGSTERTRDDITRWLAGYVTSAASSSTSTNTGGSGVTNNYYNTFNIPATDPYVLATMVARELELRSKTGAS